MILSNVLRRVTLLLTLSLLLVGCGGSHDYVFTESAAPPMADSSNRLTVRLDGSSGSIRGRISSAAVSLRVTLYDDNLSQLSTQTPARGESAVFDRLADGIYIARVAGFDGNGQAIGYFDRKVILERNADLTVLIPGLIYTSSPPAAGEDRPPSLVFTELPDTVAVSLPFRLRVEVYDKDGLPVRTAEGTLTLSSVGADPVQGNQQALLEGGVADFSGLTLPEGSGGSVVFSADGPAFRTSSTPPIAILPAPPLGSRRLQFVAVPTSAVENENFTPSFSVALRNEEGQPVQDNVTVTLSIASGPAGAVLAGPSAVVAEDGIAIFRGLSVSQAGNYTFTASAVGFASASTTQLAVSLPPFQKLAVGDYTAGAIFIYDLRRLGPGDNDLSPLLTIATELTEDNFDLASADEGNALFFSQYDEEIQLYTDIDQASGSSRPSRFLTAASDAVTLAYDEDKDILYSGTEPLTNNSGNVAVFDEAFGGVGNTTANRTITNFPGEVFAVACDSTTDRLFVASSLNLSNTFELHVFENASTVNGDQALVAHEVKEVLFPLNSTPYGGSYDPVEDRLYLGDYDATAFFFFLDDLANLADGATAGTVSTGETMTGYLDVHFDPRGGKLYVSDDENGRVLIYDNPELFTSPSVVRAPDAVLAGPATGLITPQGVTLLR